jgi:hypothetical protein
MFQRHPDRFYHGSHICHRPGSLKVARRDVVRAFLLAAVCRIFPEVPMVDFAQSKKLKNAIERLYKIMVNIEIEASLNTSDKVALNFWLIDTKNLKTHDLLGQLHDLISAGLDRGKFASETRETVLKICREQSDPPDEEEDLRMRYFE